MCRDLNEILDTLEKWGCNTRSMEHICSFRDTVEDCKLRDLGYTGSKFTWCNNMDEKAQVCERLDRFLANAQWKLIFLKVVLTHGNAVEAVRRTKGPSGLSLRPCG